MKSGLNNIDICAIVNELKLSLINKHVKNFYQLSDTEFILSYRDEGLKQLFIEIPNRLHLSEYTYEKPRFPPKFCQAIRKYIRGRRVLNCYQADHLDRIVILDIQGEGDDPWKLVMEFFGKGNIILLSPDNVVKIARRYMKMSSETVLANKQFDFPQQQFDDIFEIDASHFESLFPENQKKVVNVISRGYNINRDYGIVFCTEAGISIDAKAGDLAVHEIRDIFEAIQDLKIKLKANQLDPRILYRDPELTEQVSVEPFVFKKDEMLHAREFSSFNNAVDQFFTIDIPADQTEPKKAKKKLSKNERILVAQQQQIKEFEAQADKYGFLGDLMYQYFKPLNELLDVLLKAKKDGMEWDEIERKMAEGKEKGIEAAQIFQGHEPGQPFIKVMLEGNPVRLDIRYPLTKNINKYYYAKRKKALRKIPGARKTIERMKKLVKEEKVDEGEDLIDIPTRRRKKQWYESYRWFYSSDGFLIIAGRDASSNEAIVSKYMDENDLFFHSEIPGAPVVIVKNHKNHSWEDIPETTLHEAAIFGTVYSRSWKMGVSSADIYYVRPEQVSKSPESGEFLPKGSFVIRGERNFYRNVRMEIGVGVKLVQGDISHDQLVKDVDLNEINEMMDDIENNVNELQELHPVIVGGPLKVMEQQASYHVILVPSRGGMTKGKIASKISKMFIHHLNELVPKYRFQLKNEEIQKWIPSGESRVDQARAS